MAETLQARVPIGLNRRGSLGGREEHEPGDGHGTRRGRGASGSRPRDVGPQRRRGVRRTALMLAVIALALYFGFIAYALVLGFHARRAGTPHTTAPAAGATPGAADGQTGRRAE